MIYHEITINGQRIKLIPLGYCFCGCGRKTNPARQTNRKRGDIKGQPVRYVNGHRPTGKTGPNCPNWKSQDEYATHIGGHGYKMVLIHGHHRASRRGYVREHIIAVEKILGRPFLLPNCVHHHTPEQIVICEDQAYHILLHQRTKALRECGHAHWLRCPFCKKWGDPSNMFVHKDSNSGYHRKCHADYEMARYRRKRAELKSAP